MRDIVAWTIIVLPLLVILADGIVYGVQPTCTITCVVREAHTRSPWPEFAYVMAVVILWGHFFRRWF